MVSSQPIELRWAVPHRRDDQLPSFQLQGDEDNVTMFHKRTDEESNQPKHRIFVHQKETRGTRGFRCAQFQPAQSTIILIAPKRVLSLCTPKVPRHQAHPFGSTIGSIWIHLDPFGSIWIHLVDMKTYETVPDYKEWCHLFPQEYRLKKWKARNNVKKPGCSGLCFFPVSRGAMESNPSSSSSPDGLASKRTLRHPPTRKYLPPEPGDEVIPFGSRGVVEHGDRSHHKFWGVSGFPEMGDPPE